MTSIILYTAPNTCAKVPLILLEEIGLQFENRMVNLPLGEHKAPSFKEVNPKGKVPALVIDGEALTENSAIIFYLDRRFPDAGLMPPASDPLSQARQIADISFCGTTLHPFVTRTCMPMFFAGSDSLDEIRKMASQGVQEYFQLVEDRLERGHWWYGEDWSAMDAYLYWIFWRITSCGFDASAFPRFSDHARANEVRPAVQRAIAHERADLDQFKAEEVRAG
jgi:glutathione S-transferase